MADTEWTEEITCPHCGYVEHDAWEFIGNDETGEQECGSCGKPYIWTEYRIFRYETKPAESVPLSPEQRRTD